MSLSELGSQLFLYFSMPLVGDITISEFLELKSLVGTMSNFFGNN